jgi:hypothetical protein
MPKKPPKPLQTAIRNDLVRVNSRIDSLAGWIEAYFAFEVTTLESSQKGPEVAKLSRGAIESFLRVYPTKNIQNQPV